MAIFSVNRHSKLFGYAKQGLTNNDGLETPAKRGVGAVFEGVGSNITLLLHREHSVISGRILVVN